MTTILPPDRTSFDSIMRSIGSGLSETLPGAVKDYQQRARGMQAIDQLQNELASSGGDISKMLPAIARAYTQNQNLERSGLGQYALEMAKAKAAQNAPIAGEQSRNREPLETRQQSQQQLPGFLGQQHDQSSQFFPNNIGPQGGPGNVPQAATTGVKQPLLTRAEKIPAARELAKERTAAGIPTTPAQAMEEINAAEDDKKDYNRLIDEELKQRVHGQQNYGERAVNELKRVYPKSTAEQEAIFQKKGENVSTQGKSEADINRYLADEAKKFSNTISNVQSDISAPRLQNQLHRKFLGSDKDFSEAANDLRVKLKPILDLGLYDTARNLLTDLGYYPEERETVINPMSEKSKIIMNRIPKAERKQKSEAFMTPSLHPQYEYNSNQIENVKSGLRDLKQVDPNFSLVLARKAFEDKNYDWKVFGNALNDLIQNEDFKLEDDQFQQRTHIDYPALNGIQKILNNIGIIGR